MSGPKTPRLYVVGSMAELGEESDALHRLAAEQLELTPQDSVILAGVKAEVMQEALKSSRAKSVDICNDLDKIKPRLLKFEGDIFVKGSHSTNLHKIAEWTAALS